MIGGVFSISAAINARVHCTLSYLEILRQITIVIIINLSQVLQCATTHTHTHTPKLHRTRNKTASERIAKEWRRQILAARMFMHIQNDNAMLTTTKTTRDKFLQIDQACVIWADPWVVAVVIVIILNPYIAFALAFHGFVCAWYNRLQRGSQKWLATYCSQIRTM